MIKLMCANLSSFCAYSCAPDEDDRVGMFIAGHPLTPDTCYYEAEIRDTSMEGKHFNWAVFKVMSTGCARWLCNLVRWTYDG
jgi:hypothetical protein